MDSAPTYSLDCAHVAHELDADYASASAALRALYADVDRRTEVNVADLALPCGPGCQACCHDRVLVTPLEFLLIWEHVQAQVPVARRATMVRAGLDIAAQIESRRAVDPDALPLAFRCPLLEPDGACGVYPVRPLWCHLFGTTFNEQGGVYGCHLVGAHLAERTVTLLRAVPNARRIHALPLTFTRDTLPGWIALFFAAASA